MMGRKFQRNSTQGLAFWASTSNLATSASRIWSVISSVYSSGNLTSYSRAVGQLALDLVVAVEERRLGHVAVLEVRPRTR